MCEDIVIFTFRFCLLNCLCASLYDFLCYVFSLFTVHGAIKFSLFFRSIKMIGDFLNSRRSLFADESYRGCWDLECITINFDHSQRSTFILIIAHSSFFDLVIFYPPISSLWTSCIDKDSSIMIELYQIILSSSLFNQTWTWLQISKFWINMCNSSISTLVNFDKVGTLGSKSHI